MSFLRDVRRLLTLYRHGSDPDRPETERCYKEAMRLERREEALDELKAMNGITERGQHDKSAC